MIHVVEQHKDITDIACDDLVISVYKGQALEGPLMELNKSLGGGLDDLVRGNEISGDHKSVTIVHTLGKLPSKRLVFVGLGEREKLSFVKVRDAFARAVKTISAKAEGKKVACWIADSGTLTVERFVQAVTEAFCLASYAYHGYKEKPKKQNPFEAVDLLVGKDHLRGAEEGVEQALALSAGTIRVRDLVNTPGNFMTPGALKDAFVQVANQYGMQVEVLEKERLRELGMGGVLSVAQGSAEPPYVVVVKYQGRDTWDDVVGLIGKGVTFDTGGISIKPASGMEEMKTDMAGAATMVGVLEAIGRLGPAVNVLVVAGCVENMPSGTAYKPGDVITTMSGKTVEIITTDAEGRLVLADCITYARQQGVSCLIDCATLTGGVVVALGTIATGAMTNNQALVDELLACAEQAGERLWQLPTFEEYRELNKSRVADLKNSGGRHGHAIVGGVFLQAFAEDTPWVHLDIAGTASLSNGTDLNPAGATGAMTRTITRFLLRRSK